DPAVEEREIFGWDVRAPGHAAESVLRPHDGVAQGRDAHVQRAPVKRAQVEPALEEVGDLEGKRALGVANVAGLSGGHAVPADYDALNAMPGHYSETGRRRGRPSIIPRTSRSAPSAP